MLANVVARHKMENHGTPIADTTDGLIIEALYLKELNRKKQKR
jgi:hypothetical protein